MQDLIDGYHRFRSGRFAEQQELYNRLGDGQSPKTMVISCCDSRVDPATIFDAGPGELFVVRNVANLVPPCETTAGAEGGDYHGTSAALEFAVTGLKVSRILVMGHASCGGVNACLNHDFEDGTADSFILNWMSILKPTRDNFVKDRTARGLPVEGADAQEALEKAGVTASLKNLESFPFVTAAMKDRGLALEGAHFGIASGRLSVYDAETCEFAEVSN